MGERPVRQRPDETEKLIVTAGDDFIGLMQASRLSIGLALLWRRQAHGDPFSDFFWLHRMDAFLKLAIASDRLRDMLVVSSTGTTPKSYKEWYQAKKRTKRDPSYVTPFAEAEALLARRGLRESRLSEPLASLPELGKQLSLYRRRRNTIVHEVATRMAESTRDNISELQKRFDREHTDGFPRPPDDRAAWAAAGEARGRELEGEIDRAFNELVDWYGLLVRASNAVFQIEYWSRALLG